MEMLRRHRVDLNLLWDHNLWARPLLAPQCGGLASYEHARARAPTLTGTRAHTHACTHYYTDICTHTAAPLSLPPMA